MILNKPRHVLLGTGSLQMHSASFMMNHFPISMQVVEVLLLYLKKEDIEIYLHQTTQVFTPTVCAKETALGLLMHQAAPKLRLNFSVLILRLGALHVSLMMLASLMGLTPITVWPKLVEPHPGHM